RRRLRKQGRRGLARVPDPGDRGAFARPEPEGNRPPAGLQVEKCRKRRVLEREERRETLPRRQRVLDRRLGNTFPLGLEIRREHRNLGLADDTAEKIAKESGVRLLDGAGILDEASARQREERRRHHDPVVRVGPEGRKDRWKRLGAAEAK